MAKMALLMDPLELEQSAGFAPVSDRRRRMDEPLPVRLVAVEDVHLPALAGIEVELDQFYVGLWEFERDDESGIVYRADNGRVWFDLVERQPIVRESMRAQGIEVMSLAEAEKKLIDLEYEYIRQRGLTPGQESLLLQDPAGNWVEIFELRLVG
jgi:hypothetical protein